MGTTLGSALAGVFGVATSSVGGGNGQIPATVRALLSSAQSYYQQALTALKNEDLSTYSADMKIVGSLITEANKELKKTTKSTAAKILHGIALKPARTAGSPA